MGSGTNMPHPPTKLHSRPILLPPLPPRSKHATPNTWHWTPLHYTAVIQPLWNSLPFLSPMQSGPNRRGSINYACFSWQTITCVGATSSDRVPNAYAQIVWRCLAVFLPACPKNPNSVRLYQLSSTSVSSQSELLQSVAGQTWSTQYEGTPTGNSALTHECTLRRP